MLDQIKRTITERSYPPAMTSFQLLLGRSSRTTRDLSVPRKDGTEVFEDDINRILEALLLKVSRLKPPLGGEFENVACGADSGLQGHSMIAAPMYTLLGRKRKITSTGVMR